MNNSTIQDSLITKQCNFIKENGERCNAIQMKNSEFCYFHNPGTEAERKENIKKGGKRKIYIVNSDAVISQRVKFPLTKPKDVTRFLSDLIENTVNGKIDVRISSSIAYLCSTLLKSMELTEVENRISDIESLINEKLNNLNNE